MSFDWQSFLDWVSVVSAIGTVAATGFAAWAIVQSSKQAKANADLVVHERRIDVQLGALQRLADVVASPNYTVEQQEHRRLQATLQLAIIDAALPVSRARFGSRDLRVTRDALGIPEGQGWSAFDTWEDDEGVGVSDRIVREIAAVALALTSARPGLTTQRKTSPQEGHSR